MDVFDLTAKITCDTSEYEKSLDDASQKSSSFKDTVKAILVSDVIQKGISTLTGGVKDFASKSLEAGKNFESSMSQIAATLGMSMSDISNNVNGAGDTFDALKEKALEMGRSTNFTASEAAEGLNILAMSGYDANDSIAMIEDVLHLAAAGSMDMASAAGYVSGTMKGFNDETKDSGYYADLMAKGATLANTSVSQLGEAMADGSATASAYGQTADSMVVSLLRLAEQGVTGSAAGTALAAAMKNLYTPTKEAKGALDELGVSAYDSSGKSRDFNDVVNDLQGALVGYSDEQKNAYLQTIFGIQGLDAYNKMTVTGVEKQNEWSEALAGASDGMGEAAKQYETMTSNYQGKLDLFGSALEGLQIAVSNVFLPLMSDALEAGANLISGITEKFNEADVAGKVQGAVDKIKEIWEGISPGIEEAWTWVKDTVLGGIKDGISALSTVANNVFSNIQKFWEETLSPVFSAIWSLVTETLAPDFESAFNAIGEVVTGAFNEINRIWEEVLSPVFSTISEIVVGLIETFRNAWEENISPTITNVFNTIKTAWEEKLKPAFDSLIKTVRDEIVPKVADAWTNIIEPAISTAFTLIQEAWNDVLKPVFDTLVEFIADPVIPTIEELATWFGDMYEKYIKPLAEYIGKEFMDVWEAIKKVWTEVIIPKLSLLKTAFNELKEKVIKPLAEVVEKTLVKAFTTLKDFWENTLKPKITSLSESLNKIWNDVILPFATSIKEDFQGAWEGLKTFWADYLEPAIQTLSDGLSKIWNEILVPVAEFLGDTFQQAWSGIVDFWNNDLSDAISTITGFIQYLWEDILKPVADFVVGTFKTAFVQISNFWSNTLKPSVEKITDKIGAFWEKAQGLWEAISAFFIPILDGLWISMGDLWDIFSSVADFIGSVFTGAVSAAESVVSGLIGIVQGAWTALSNFLSFYNNSHEAVVSANSTADYITNPYQNLYYAEGGTLHNGDIGIVGEAGAELLEMRGGTAKITPLNGGSPLAGLGGNQQFTFNIYSQPGQSEEQIARQVQKQFVLWERQKEAAMVS